jgi:hypothetical protein
MDHPTLETTMKPIAPLIAALVAVPAGWVQAQQSLSPNMSFFVTSSSPGKGGDLGGLDGADRHCQELAQAVGAGSKTWRAYLSTQAASGAPAVNAKDRIGTGPWHNAKGTEIAGNVDELHGENFYKLNKTTALTEKGEFVNGRGDAPTQHDMLTGSQHDGTAFPSGEDKTCHNWTSSSEGSAIVGHADLVGNTRGPNFWNFSHATPGCSVPDLAKVGGAGFYYCFAVR